MRPEAWLSWQLRAAGDDSNNDEYYDDNDDEFHDKMIYDINPKLRPNHGFIMKMRTKGSIQDCVLIKDDQSVLWCASTLSFHRTNYKDIELCLDATRWVF